MSINFVDNQYPRFFLKVWWKSVKFRVLQDKACQTLNQRLGPLAQNVERTFCREGFLVPNKACLQCYPARFHSNDHGETLSDLSSE